MGSALVCATRVAVHGNSTYLRAPPPRASAGDRPEAYRTWHRPRRTNELRGVSRELPRRLTSSFIDSETRCGRPGAARVGRRQAGRPIAHCTGLTESVTYGEFPERVQSTLPSVGDRISTTIYCDQPTTRPLDLGVEITKNHSFRQTARPLRSSYRRSRVLPADEPVPEVGVNLPRRKLFDFLGALVAESPFIPATG